MTDPVTANAGGEAPPEDNTDPEAGPVYGNPYMSHPDEPSMCGFGQKFLVALFQMVNQYQIMPQDMIAALTPPPEVRAAMLREQAAGLEAMAQRIEDEAKPDGPAWNSKWKGH